MSLPLFFYYLAQSVFTVNVYSSLIFLTGKNDKESIMKVLELKPEGYLLKSMEPAKIIQEIDNFFEKQKYTT